MENNPLDSGMPGTQTGRLPESALMLIKSIAGWTRFIGIVGAVMIVLLVILAFGMGTIMTAALAQTEAAGAIPGVFFTIIYLVFAALYGLPVYYLLSFSKYAKRYYAGNAIEDGINALKYIKNFFLFIGVLTIIMLGFYAIAIIGGAMSALFI